MTRVDHPELRAKFSVQRSDAKRRGIPFLLTFDEWFDIWKASGRLNERGNKSGCYVMARYGDRGAYAIGNVRIILFEENTREYRPTLDAKTRTGAAHAGKIVSAETRRKLAQKATGRRMPLEARDKMRASAKRVAKFRSRNECGQFM